LKALDVITEIIINRPREQVASFACEPDNAPKWYVNIKSVKWVTERPLRVGSRMTFVAHFLGKKLEYTYEVMEFSPGKIFRMKTFEGPFPMETTYTWEALNEDATRMTLRNRGEPSGFSTLAAPFMSMAMKKANQKDLLALKKILETF
jgi:uncharacterized membrane protein